MNKTLLGILILILTSTIFSSCSIEKRVYQDGYHITWKNIGSTSSERRPAQTAKPEITSVETPGSSDLSTTNDLNEIDVVCSTSKQELFLSPRKNKINKEPFGGITDTIVPPKESQHEEYFSNSYSAPVRTNELKDTKLANWALGLGIAALSSPLWISLLFFLVFALVGASMASASVWMALTLAVLLGGGIFITLEALAITFAIRFLRMHGKDPNYRKYRSRAITGLILASIYPALMLLNIIISLAFII